MASSGGSRPPTFYRFVRDRTAQSSTIAMVLIFALVVTGTGLVVSLGMDAINETEQSATVSRVENSMLRFDSAAAMVGLGETPIRTVQMGTTGQGQFTADSDAGWIKIVHVNATADDEDRTILNKTDLGTFTYRNGGTTIAYQAGGVWWSTGNGSVMIAQPEFHYRQNTLTLPIITIANNESFAGEATAILDRVGTTRVFPNESKPAFSNPIRNGTVEVTVHSQFYQGWATYFRERTSGRVSVDHENETVHLELVAIGEVGNFALANALDDDGLTVQGQAAGHSLTDFNLTVVKDHGTFNNMYITFWADEGPHRLELIFHYKNNKPIDMWVFYRDTSTGVQHEWYNESIDAKSGPIRVNDDENKLYINFTGKIPMKYSNTTIDNPDAAHYEWDKPLADPVYFNHSSPDDPDGAIDSGEELPLYNISRHYFAFYGISFELKAKIGTGDRGSAQIDIAASGGNLNYETSDAAFVITFLHVSKNEVEVEFR